MIPAFVISLSDKQSRQATNTLLETIRQTDSPLTTTIFPAIDARHAEREMNKEKLEYTYPQGVEREDYGMTLKPYKTVDLRKRIGCFMSHYRLWQLIAENIDHHGFAIILEQDAKFVERFDEEYFRDVKDYRFICGLNSPIGATFNASHYDRALKEAFKSANSAEIEVDPEYEDVSSNDNDGSKSGYTPTFETDFNHFAVPWVSEQDVPQGLAGNSAYLLTPLAAKDLIEKTHEIGIWPNDALICKQFFNNMLFTAYPYYTKVQGNSSTTSL